MCVGFGGKQAWHASVGTRKANADISQYQMPVLMDAGTHLNRKIRIVFYIKASPPYRKAHVIIAAFMSQQADLNWNSIYLVSTVSPALRVWLLSACLGGSHGSSAISEWKDGGIEKQIF